MSVDPVGSFNPASEVAPGEAALRSRQSQSSPVPEPAANALSASNLDTQPKQENEGSSTVPAEAEFPEDEVQLQQDTEIRDQVIVRYLDKSTGGVVLQVPSQQVLAVARGIYEDFQKQAATREPGDSTASVSGEGGKPNGN